MASVVVVGGSAETRMLLRGLLRLNRHQVFGEGEKIETLNTLPRDAPSPTVIFDVDLGETIWSDAIRKALGDRPELRSILLVPSRSPRVEASARAVGITAIVRRPFSIHELMEAVAPPTSVTPPSSPEPPSASWP